MEPENAAIVLTPPGCAAIAVVRLIGPNVAAFLATHFTKPARPGRCVHGELRDGANVLDDPVIVLHADQHTADINLHGGGWVVRSILDLADRNGFAIVEGRQPLDGRALDADTPLQRDMLAQLPLARTQEALRRLLAQPRAWRALARKLMTIAPFPSPASAAEGTVGPPASRRWRLSGPDLGQVPGDPHAARSQPPPQSSPGVPGVPGEEAGGLTSPLARAEVRAEIQAILADSSLDSMLRLPRVAIAGEPNVGKSTLANRLFARQRSITADLPGTTRDWVGDVANLDGLAVMLLDLPGLRATDDPIEAAAIATGQRELRDVDLVIVVLDATRPAAQQAEMGRRFPEAICVANKIDAAAASPRTLTAEWAGALPVSALTGEGVGALRGAIRARFGCDATRQDRAACWTAQQRGLLAACLDHLSSADNLAEYVGVTRTHEG